MLFLGIIDFLCLLALPVSIIWFLISLFLKKNKKIPTVVFLLSLSIFIISNIIYGIYFYPLQPKKEETAKIEEVEEVEEVETVVEIEEPPITENVENKEILKEEVVSEEKEDKVIEQERPQKEEKEIASQPEIEINEEIAEKAEVFDNKIFLSETTDLTEAQIDNAIKLLDKIGYNDFEFGDIRKGGGIESRKNYWIWYNIGGYVPHRFKLSFSDEDVWLVKDISNIYMYTKNNGIIYTLDDFDISYEEKLNAINIAQDYIKRILIDSSSADFPSVTLGGDWGLTRCGDYIFVGSYVEGNNAFGGNARNDFYIQMTYPDMEVFYCEIGNETIGEGVDTNDGVDIEP